MTSSPPNISSLSLSSPSQQRLHETAYDYEGNGGNGRPQYHFSTSPSVVVPSQYNPLSMSTSPLKNNKPATRGGLPVVCRILSKFQVVPLTVMQQWLDASSETRSLSPNNNSDFSSAGGSPPPVHLTATPLGSATPTINPDDEVIPTAIVIKNIPFNVKRETLLDIIVSVTRLLVS
jgi:hypothetical protein